MRVSFAPTCLSSSLTLPSRPHSPRLKWARAFFWFSKSFPQMMHLLPLINFAAAVTCLCAVARCAPFVEFPLIESSKTFVQPSHPHLCHPFGTS